MKKHSPLCVRYFPECPCNTCRRDNYRDDTDETSPYCVFRQHRRKCGETTPCPDYIKEKLDPKIEQKN